MKIIPQVVAFIEKKVACNKNLVSMYSNFYQQVIENEINLAAISENDQVLNVGCGAIPFTAILIAQKTGAKVIAIDCDQIAVKVARQCLATQQLDDLVTVMHLDGAGEIPFTFDVAIVALQAKPKKAILENLMKNGNGQVRLVFRKPRRKLAHQYDLLPDKPQVSAYINQDKATFDISVLYAH
jgi:protein-L-isoaspartate O-methyltransferase